VNDYLAEFGYLAVAVGALLEGETILLLAGFAAQQGVLELPLVLLLGIIGAFAGDQFWFHVARRQGGRWLAHRPHLLARAAGALAALERHATLFILSFRFILGMRNLGAMVVGISRVPTLRFAVLNFIAATVWAVCVVLAGFYFGEAAAALVAWLDNIVAIAAGIAALLLALVVGSWLLRRWLLQRLS
jgi:membrane protein DedA with SNARE-associated domain